MKDQNELSNGTVSDVTGGTGFQKDEFGSTCPKCGSTDIKVSYVSLTPEKNTVMKVCNSCGYFSSTGFSGSDNHSLQ